MDVAELTKRIEEQAEKEKQDKPQTTLTDASEFKAQPRRQRFNYESMSYGYSALAQIAAIRPFESEVTKVAEALKDFSNFNHIRAIGFGNFGYLPVSEIEKFANSVSQTVESVKENLSQPSKAVSSVAEQMREDELRRARAIDDLIAVGKLRSARVMADAAKLTSLSRPDYYTKAFEAFNPTSLSVLASSTFYDFKAISEAVNADFIYSTGMRSALESSVIESINKYIKIETERVSQLVHSLISHSPFAKYFSDVKEVSIEVILDDDRILKAKYDRRKLLDKLRASFVQEYLGGESLVINQIDADEPDTLFDCSAEYDGHPARVKSKTNIERPYGQDDQNISELIDELQATGHLSEEGREQIEMKARRAEIIIREALPLFMFLFVRIFIYMAIREVKGKPLSAKEFKKILEDLFLSVSEFIRARAAGRPKGSGAWFKSMDDFKIALEDVLRGFSKKPSRPQVVKALKKHHLCQNRKIGNLQNQSKTLDRWLDDIGFKNLDEAWNEHNSASRQH